MRSNGSPQSCPSILIRDLHSSLVVRMSENEEKEKKITKALVAELEQVRMFLDSVENRVAEFFSELDQFLLHLRRFKNASNFLSFCGNHDIWNLSSASTAINVIDDDLMFFTSSWLSSSPIVVICAKESAKTVAKAVAKSVARTVAKTNYGGNREGTRKRTTIAYGTTVRSQAQIPKVVKNEDGEEDVVCEWDQCETSTNRGDISKKTEWMKTHFKTRHITNARPFKCLIEGCTVSKATSKDLETHVRNHHLNKPVDKKKTS
ncbi:unnamed protein product [Caenorhabditis nigoni]